MDETRDAITDGALRCAMRSHSPFQRARRCAGGIVRNLGAGLALLISFSSHAQTIQRSFINLGFEQPVVGTDCAAIIPQTLIPGWSTTHPSGGSTYFGSGCTPIPSPPAPLIEVWTTRGTNVAREGNQFAELNAAASSRIYQDVCLISGETVNWIFSHRGRDSAATADVMQFDINSTANRIRIARTRSNGVHTTLPGDCPASSGLITGNTCSAPVTMGVWADYAGSFVWNGGSGTHNIGFGAISTATGDLGRGNFLDRITVVLKPVVEFATGALTTVEGGSQPIVQIRIVGIVTAPLTIPITASGTADSSDYTLGAMTVPAGDYSSGALFTVPLTIVDDTVIENNETLVLTIVPPTSSASYLLSSTSVCNAAGNSTTTLTIVDNDIDLATTKTVSNATPLAGEAFTYTVTYRNNTARPTIAPTTAHDATAAIADAQPTGIAFTAWTCQASNGASCPGGAVNGTTSGSGSISGNAFLPAGDGAAGGLLTYTITAVAAPGSCDAIINTSTIATPSGLTEGTSAQPGFTTPPPGGAANNVASAEVDPVCTIVRLRKALPDGRAVEGHQFTLNISGDVASTVNTTGSGTVAEGVAIIDPATAGYSYQLREDPLTMANLDAYTVTWNCTNALAGGQQPSGSGNSFTLTPAAGDDLTCTFVNALTPTADLWVRKTNTPAQGPDDQADDTVLSGSETIYTIVVGNDGPAAADGAVVRDPAPTGMTCHTASCGSETGGALCPAVSVAALQGAGVTIATFPAGGTVTLTLACTVH